MGMLKLAAEAMETLREILAALRAIHSEIVLTNRKLDALLLAEDEFQQRFSVAALAALEGHYESA